MNSIYENPDLLADYLLFHYGSQEDILTPDIVWPSGMKDALDFPIRTTRHFSEKSCKRALDLGCAVGASTFEISKNCEEVIGIDFSNAFINTANRIRSGQSVSYFRKEEGHVQTPIFVSLPEGIDPSRTRFQQGDAMNLPIDLGQFDRVHAANLICRLSDPCQLFKRLPTLVKSGGELILATPCTWLEDFTPKENWPPKNTFSWLKNHLENDFKLIQTTEEPFLIRETARKFQWTLSLLSYWHRL